MHDAKPRTNPATDEYDTQPHDCWACVPISATVDDNGNVTTTHETGCQHIAEQRARFTTQAVTA